MKLLMFFLALIFISNSIFSQNQKITENTLLWKISGNGLTKPSYLFGTIHIICEKDAGLSDSLINAIIKSDEIYFEIDLNNVLEMFKAIRKMEMRNDTTLHDLISVDDYKKLQHYFENAKMPLPFYMIEKFKPMLIAGMIGEGQMPCEKTTMMEQSIMKEAKLFQIKINGLETMSYQAEVLDAIPYKIQALELIKYMNNSDTGKTENIQLLMDAYKTQNLQELEKLINNSEIGVKDYKEILLDNRNKNWVEKLNKLMKNKSLIIAVGAGHLVGKKGLIALLRDAGYIVLPIENKIIPPNII